MSRLVRVKKLSDASHVFFEAGFDAPRFDALSIQEIVTVDRKGGIFLSKSHLLRWFTDSKTRQEFVILSYSHGTKDEPAFTEVRGFPVRYDNPGVRPADKSPLFKGTTE